MTNLFTKLLIAKPLYNMMGPEISIVGTIIAFGLTESNSNDL